MRKQQFKSINDKSHLFIVYTKYHIALTVLIFNIQYSIQYSIFNIQLQFVESQQ